MINNFYGCRYKLNAKEKRGNKCIKKLGGTREKKLKANLFWNANTVGMQTRCPCLDLMLHRYPPPEYQKPIIRFDGAQRPKSLPLCWALGFCPCCNTWASAFSGLGPFY